MVQESCGSRYCWGSQFNLALSYDKGEGVPKDLPEAAKWWRKAADQGFAEAQRNFGICFLRGDGVEKRRKLQLSG